MVLQVRVARDLHLLLLLLCSCCSAVLLMKQKTIKSTEDPILKK
jgi:hypothetical protein